METAKDEGVRPPLPPKQQRVLEIIAAAVRERGFPPTVREIATALGIRSTNAVGEHIKALEKKGYLTREPGRSRGLQLCKDAVPSEADQRDQQQAALNAAAADLRKVQVACTLQRGETFAEPSESAVVASVVRQRLELLDLAQTLAERDRTEKVLRETLLRQEKERTARDGSATAEAARHNEAQRDPSPSGQTAEPTEEKRADLRQGHRIANHLLKQLTAQCESPSQDILLGLAIALAMYAGTTGAIEGGVLDLVKMCLRAPMTEVSHG